METRANYILVGLFVLLLTFGALGFVVWVARFQFDQEFARYDIVFDDAVTGVRQGSAVRYNGVGVGEVLSVDLDPRDPTRIRVRIEVEKRTPVRSDSMATLELEGLTGGRYVLLTGGSPDAPPLLIPPGRKIAEIPSGTSSFAQVLEGAPEVIDNVNILLVRFQRLLSDKNLASIESTLSSVAEVTGTISENREKIGPLIDEAAMTMRNIREATEGLEPLIASANLTVEDARTLIASLDNMANRLTGASGQIEDMIAENRTPIRDFTTTGLYELTNMLIEARELIVSLNRVSTEVERDPARFLFGDQQQGYEAQQ